MKKKSYQAGRRDSSLRGAFFAATGASDVVLGVDFWPSFLGFLRSAAAAVAGVLVSLLALGGVVCCCLDGVGLLATCGFGAGLDGVA